MSSGKPATLRATADLTIDPDVVERTVSDLLASHESALVKASAEGLPDPAEVAAWVERCRRLVLMQHERSALRSEVPQLARRLHELLEHAEGGDRASGLPEGAEGRDGEVLKRYAPTTPPREIAQDIEAALAEASLAA